ncbi:response regulator [Flavobacterium sp.]|uniref:response regulator n=1 Tax=Flavobacterium sp. TaxID=239 RepID=UPI00120CC84C|nr:response regulator [Flavobacterium sp.]RZJ70101.1 MAG: response regulator [Flavobacterium sp.]
MTKSQDRPYELVLSVDDNAIDRYICSTIVKKFNFAKRVLEFDMATKALDYLKENAHIPENIPQIIFLDINMPGMNGFEFLEEASKLSNVIKNTCCIVMLTSSLNPDDRDRASRSTIVKDYINKPLSQSKLDEVEEIFNSQFNGCGEVA